MQLTSAGGGAFWTVIAALATNANTVRWLMENEIELLNQTEADLLMLMQQYKSGQYCHLADCIRRVRVVRETLRHLTTACTGLAPAGAQVSEGSTGASQ